MLKIEGQYISNIWFLHGKNVGFDVMGSLYKNGDKFELAYRFRYYNGDQSKDAFEDGDTKSGYILEFEKNVSEEEVLKKARMVFSELAKLAGLTVESLPVRTSDPEKVMNILFQQPWVHSKTIPNETS